MENFYYRTGLSGEAREAYEAIRRGMASFAPSVRVPFLSGAALGDILAKVRLDSGRLAFYGGVSIRAVPGATHAELRMDYSFPPQKAKTMLETVDTRVRRVAAPAMSLDAEAKIRYVHDWLIDSVRYDKLEKNYAHEVTGPLCHGVGVCEGIAKTAALLLCALGIPSAVVIGEEDPDKHGIEGMRHAWNLVQLEQQWYHMDATFDLSLSRCGVRRYDYYLIGDREISFDHRAPLYPVTPCPASYDFYRRERMQADTAEALGKLLPRLARRRRAFQVKLGEEIAIPAALEAMHMYGQRCGMSARVSMNRTQRVLLVTLAERGENETKQEVIDDESLPD